MWFAIDGHVHRITGPEAEIREAIIALTKAGHTVKAARPPVVTSAPRGYGSASSHIRR